MAKKKQEKQPSIIQQSVAAAFQGPLPLPSHLREYDEIVPGAAERILAMAEKQSVHRRDLEAYVTRGDGHRAWAGLVIGGMLAAGCIGGGIWLVSLGQSSGGIAIATSTVATLAAVFVYGTQSRRKERTQRLTPR